MFSKEKPRLGSAAWVLGAAWKAAFTGSVMFIISGGYADYQARQARMVVIETDPALQLESANAHLTERDWAQIDCLARNNYFEAANQTDDGMAAVTDVVFNRIEDPKYPGSPCEVITQHGQFSWYEDGRPHVMADGFQTKRAYKIALDVWQSRPVHYKPEHKDMTGGATRYHAFYVSPNWKKWRQTVKIGAHLFYRPEAKS